jgi:hypothetical protein
VVSALVNYVMPVQKIDISRRGGRRLRRDHKLPSTRTSSAAVIAGCRLHVAIRREGPSRRNRQVRVPPSRRLSENESAPAVRRRHARNGRCRLLRSGELAALQGASARTLVRGDCGVCGRRPVSGGSDALRWDADTSLTADLGPGSRTAERSVPGRLPRSRCSWTRIVSSRRTCAPGRSTR